MTISMSILYGKFHQCDPTRCLALKTHSRGGPVFASCEFIYHVDRSADHPGLGAFGPNVHVVEIWGQNLRGKPVTLRYARWRSRGAWTVGLSATGSCDWSTLYD